MATGAVLAVSCLLGLALLAANSKPESPGSDQSKTGIRAILLDESIGRRAIERSILHAKEFRMTTNLPDAWHRALSSPDIPVGRKLIFANAIINSALKVPVKVTEFEQCVSRHWKLVKGLSFPAGRNFTSPFDWDASIESVGFGAVVGNFGDTTCVLWVGVADGLVVKCSVEAVGDP